MNNSLGKEYDVIVIGAGPAGMMAAARAGERGRSVSLLEKNARLGKKLSITGGGRCNVTNNKPDVRTMLAMYKDAEKFLYSAFAQHDVSSTKDWFHERGIALHEENENRLFPDTNSAESVCATLAAELTKQNVDIELNCGVAEISHSSGSNQFEILLTSGKSVQSKKCIVATGGTSRPETGSTGEGFSWLKQLGHTIHQNNYALVPLKISEPWVARVSGVVVEGVKISVYADNIKKHSVRGKLLFTHVGVSGPTILNMSSDIGELLEYSDVRLSIDLFPAVDEGGLRNVLNEQLAHSSNKQIHNVLAAIMPRALATIVLGETGIDAQTPAHSVRSEERVALVAYLKNIPLTVSGLLGADKAVISGGGVALEEVNFKTMESRLIEGLYLVGDVLDIDRPSGGYSLQLCWSTGYVAGQSA